MTELLRDKGENGGYITVLNRLRKDIAALNDTPDAPIHFYRNPRRLLNNLEKAGLPAHGFPVSDYKPLNYMRFITNDEVDFFLAQGSSYSESKLQILSYFLSEHTPQERVKFLKDKYGHSGGTWIGGGMYNAEPGKGIRLERPDCEDVNINWNQAVRRIDELIKSGQYISRSDLDKIPGYERLILARDIKNFYYDLPEGYMCPFPKEMDFHYPHEEEWTAINSFLDDKERIHTVLGEMQYIFVNTPQEDRYYNLRSTGFINLSNYYEGIYTLFSGLENASVSEVSINPTAIGEQFTIFEFEPPPELPSVAEQQIIIEKSQETQAEANAPAFSLPVTQDDIDALLLTITDENKTRLSAQLSDNPRSRETVQLVREIYGGINETISKSDDSNGYLSIYDGGTGVIVTVSSNENQPTETLALPWAAVVKRLSELAGSGGLAVIEQELYSPENTEINVDSDQSNIITESDFDTVASNILELAMKDTEFADSLINAHIRGELRNPTDKVLDKIYYDLTLQQNELPLYQPYFTNSDLNDKLFDFVYRRSWEIKQKQEAAIIPETVIIPSDEQKNVAVATILESSLRPPPVFFVDWDEAQFDFDLTLYNDHDIIGYDKNGVEYSLAKSDSLIYVTSTGMLWGENSIPGNIYEQITAYNNGELTDEQVRDNYLNVLKKFIDHKAADITESNDDLFDVINNGLISQTEKETILSMLKGGVVNDDISVLLSESYSGTNETMTLITGETAVYSTSSDGLFIEIPDKFNTKLSFTWDYIATVVRSLSERWTEPQSGEHEIISDEDNGLKIDYITENKTSDSVQRISTKNFHITDDHLGEGGAKIKFRNNIAAINLLHELEFNKRPATPDEQEILSRYVGWGGLPQAFDPENKQWETEYLELNAALSPEDWESARTSTLNAHYTSPTVIKAMYEAVERMGFKFGNILEPSCGVGNFFGLLPESMRHSKLYGVELDSITGRIAQQLYPNADIKITGFEKTDTSDAFFDVAIGNVPFGNYPVADKRYDKYKFSIHDYFFAKTLDQVRPGGIIAFITSKYTLDKQNPEVRKYIAQRAELLGAIRLPNDAFLKNAGTETTMDIIFLQKRDRPMDIEPDWVHLGLTEDGLPVNRYYLDNPEMILGKMALDEHMNNKYGSKDVTCCLPTEGADLAEQLKTAIGNIQGTYTIDELDDIEGIDNHAIPADPNIKNFSYTTVDNTVYFRENSLMYPVDLPVTTLERIKGMIYLRDCAQELISLQLDEHSDVEIKAKQAELSELYDQFTIQYGLINSQANNRAFNADNAYYLLCSLEILDEDGNLERKADMFTKRTIKQRTTVTHVDTASEALAVSLGERACVDMKYMSELTGKDETTLFSELRGVIFLDYHFNGDINSYTYRTADDFLSGNVREKLKKYKENSDVPENFVHYRAFMDNIEALSAAVPKDLDASEIAVRLGSTWVSPDYVQQFMYELLNTSYYNKNIYQVKYHQFTGEWQVTSKGRAQYSDINATVTYGTSRMNAYQIIDDTLNLRDVRVYDYKEDADGKEKRILNKKETTLAQQKQEQIKQSFKDWIWKDPERRQTLVREYNDKFNSVRPREYNGNHITFSGISPEIIMRPHQLNAVAHILYGGNTLLAHVVGAGKTFEMVGAAMEAKRLGLCHKSLFAVPNHLTEQWAGEFLRLYPSANILVASKKDFEMRNRKKFCAKIATGDYDAVIIGHSQLEKIPMSQERQKRLFNEQLYDIEEGIRELKASNGERFSIKQLEKTKKSIEARLTKLLESKKRDDVVTYEQLGVDRLFVDEAHNFNDI